MKRLVVIADLHCGHRAGLTPPSYQHMEDVDDHILQKYAKGRRLLWDFYFENIEKLQPIHTLVVNGDAVDGKGAKSGGSELITTDRTVQADMAAECIALAKAKKIIMTYGTPYHTGVNEDWEDLVAEKVGAEKIGGEEWCDLDGILFNFKHWVSRSVIPHGRHTPIAREQVWGLLAKVLHDWPAAHVVVRSHVHYYIGGENFGRYFFTTPALQAHTKYGVRQTSGMVDIGVMWFENEKGKLRWGRELLNLRNFAPVPVKL